METTLEKKNMEIARMMWTIEGTGFCNYWRKKSGAEISTSQKLKFHIDVNWLYEALEFIENEEPIKGYIVDFIISKNHISYFVVEKETAERKYFWTSTYGGKEDSIQGKRMALFEGIYHFSQYLKEKE